MMAIHRSVFTFMFLTIFIGCASQKQTQCFNLDSKSSRFSTVVAESQKALKYACPRDFDPKSFTKCCHNESCCEPSLISLDEDNESLLMITAILVISTCTFLTVLVVVCCFWSKCPLYTACRANYNTTNVIVYSLGKDDPTPLMPAEVNKKGQYHPCTVKIRKVQEV